MATVELTAGTTYTLQGNETVVLPNVAGEARLISLLQGYVILYNNAIDLAAGLNGVRIDATPSDRNHTITFLTAGTIAYAGASPTVFTLGAPIVAGGSGGGSATETTLAAILTEIRDDVQLAESIWRDSITGTYYVRQTQIEENSQVQSVIWKDLSGVTVATPTLGNLVWASGTNLAMTTYRNETQSALSLVAAGARAIFGLNLINLDTVPVYLKIFNAANTGAVTLGTTTPARTIAVPAGGVVIIEPSETPLNSFSLGIVVACTTGQLTASTAAPTIGLLTEVTYV